MQDEFNRYMWDVYISEQSTIIQSMITDYVDNIPALMVAVTKGYLGWIEDESKQTTDEHRKYILNFLRVMRIFWLYWFSIRVGDRICQEQCITSWLPVFFVLKKRNYVEIVLSAIEKEYKHISYFDLSCV